MFSTEEKIEMFLWYQSGLSLANVRDHFYAKYPTRPIPNVSTISRLVQKFKKTGCIAHKSIRNRRKIDENLELEICQLVVENKNISLREIAVQVTIYYILL